MYTGRWSPGLRQGDILGPLPFPLLSKRFDFIAQAQASLVGPREVEVSKVILDAARAFVVVVSHDCEFNEGKRAKLGVARLQRPRGDFTEEQHRELRESNDIEARVAADKPVAGVDNFVFDPIPGVFETVMVASFTTITPLPMEMVEDVAESKRAELLHDVRVQFRRKLGFFFGRDADDIPDEEKTDKPPPASAI